MKLLEQYIINDYRSIKQLNNITISNYKKNDTMKAMHDSIKKGLIENSCFWSAELISSGYIKDVINNIILYFFKDINIGNPNIGNHLWNRIKCLNNNMKIDNNIKLRNCQILRNTVCELVTIACLSKKNKLPEKIKIDRNDFDVSFIKTKLIANNFNLTSSILKSEDPEEIKMISNEFAFNLHNNNFNLVIYWLSWLAEWEKINLKNKNKLTCASRNKFTKNINYANDYIWIIWEIIINEAVTYRSNELKNNIQSLVNLYIFDYTSGQKTRKMSYIYFALMLLNNKLEYSPSVYINYPIILQAVCNINLIYKQIKINEKINKTDCIFKINSVVRNDNISNITNSKEEILKNKEDEKIKKQQEIQKNKDEKVRKKLGISSKSVDKMLMVMQIDNKMNNIACPDLYKNQVKKDRINLEINKKPIDKISNCLIEDNIKKINNKLFNY